MTVAEAAAALGWVREGVRKAILRGDLIACCPLALLRRYGKQKRATVMVLRSSVERLKQNRELLAARDRGEILRVAYAQLEERSRYLTNGCREWTGRRTNSGYGHVFAAGQALMVHRVSYEFHHGPIPAGYHVHHRCRNRSCWNPDHLQAVPPALHQELDACVGARNRYATHCVHGHAFTPENTYEYQHGKYRRRACQTCKLRLARIQNQHRSQRKTHCPKGHEYTEANTLWVRARGDSKSRRCLICRPPR